MIDFKSKIETVAAYKLEFSFCCPDELSIYDVADKLSKLAKHFNVNIEIECSKKTAMHYLRFKLLVTSLYRDDLLYAVGQFHNYFKSVDIGAIEFDVVGWDGDLLGSY